MKSQEQRPLPPQWSAERRGSPALHIYQGIPQTYRVFPNECLHEEAETPKNDVPKADE